MNRYGRTKTGLAGIVALLLGCGIATGARADIYRLQGDDETLSFTDSPRDRRFQLVIKEPRQTPATTTRKGPVKPVAGSETPPAVTGGTLPIQGRLTSSTGLRHDPFDGKLKHHNGLDIAAPIGTPVKPVAPGTVLFSGWKPGYGNTVIVEHDDGTVTIYAHHAGNNVAVGEYVGSGTVIAQVGSTGRSTGPHLHFEAWREGVNISRQFIPGSGDDTGRTVAAAPINRYLSEDGTLVFTNLR